MITLESINEEVIAEMERLRTMYALKKTLRYQGERDHSVHSESVAEHIFGIMLLVDYFLPLEDPEGALDKGHIYELLVYHELGEVETGDVLFHKKDKEMREAEKEAAARVAQKLPKELQGHALALCLEFENMASPEARFASALDKIEPLFELFEDTGLSLFKKLNVDAETAKGNKIEATQEFPYMRKIIEAWMERSISKNIFPTVE